MNQETTKKITSWDEFIVWLHTMPETDSLIIRTPYAVSKLKIIEYKLPSKCKYCVTRFKCLTNPAKKSEYRYDNGHFIPCPFFKANSDANGVFSKLANAFGEADFTKYLRGERHYTTWVVTEKDFPENIRFEDRNG